MSGSSLQACAAAVVQAAKPAAGHIASHICSSSGHCRAGPCLKARLLQCLYQALPGLAWVLCKHVTTHQGRRSMVVSFISQGMCHFAGGQASSQAQSQPQQQQQAQQHQQPLQHGRPMPHSLATSVPQTCLPWRPSAMAPRPASQWPPRSQNSTAAVVWPGSASPGRPLQGAGPHASMAAQQSPGYIPQSPGYTPQSPLYNAQSPRYQPPPLPPSVAVGIAILSLTRPCPYREMVMHAKIFSRVTKGRTDLNSSAYEDCKVVTAWSAEILPDVARSP